jgi:hypothetical protein
MYCPTVEYIRPRGHPFRTHAQYLAIHPILCALGAREPSCNPPHKALSLGRRVLRISKRPEPVKPLSTVSRAFGTNHWATVENTVLLLKAPRGATPGARSDPKHRQIELKSNDPLGPDYASFSCRPIPPAVSSWPTKGQSSEIAGLKPLARPFCLLVDPGDICPPQAPNLWVDFEIIIPKILGPARESVAWFPFWLWARRRCTYWSLVLTLWVT